MGRMARSWEMVKQSFSVLRSDKQLMLLPVASAIACFFVTVLIALGGLGLALTRTFATMAQNREWVPNPAMMWGGLLILYLANYLVIVYFNVALVVAATGRIAGGHTTLREALGRAWERKRVILQWALLAGTVGVLLRMLEDQLGWVGQISMRLTGIAWTLATFFVVPVLAFENLGPVATLKRSGKLFRKTWGEEVTGGFSFALIFLPLILSGVALWIVMLPVLGSAAIIPSTVLLMFYLIVLATMNATVQGIFIAALYRYASTGDAGSAFKPEDLSMAWQKK
jgi:Family of unknown function (DUF6159)